MIVPDLNLLLMAYFPQFPDHARAVDWATSVFGGPREVGLAPPVVFGFVRLATKRGVFTSPATVSEATERVESWLARPNVRLLPAGPRHLQIAFRLLREAGAAGNLTTDAQIAAHAIEYNAEVHSNDTDFGRFSGLRWRDPLRG